MSEKITRKTVEREEEALEAIVCDSCGKVVEVNDHFEIQEMLRWRMTGGFGSIFGDGAEISVDLCQDCIMTRLGDCLKFNDACWEDR